MLDSTRVLFLPVDAISPNPDQPRRVFSQHELEELADSIRALGVLQPLTVRRGSGALGAGGRGAPPAGGQAGRSEGGPLPARPGRQPVLLPAGPGGEPAAPGPGLLGGGPGPAPSLIDTYHLSQEEAARRIGKSQSAVANKLRLLKLPAPVLERLREGGGTERHARALLRLDDPEVQSGGGGQVLSEKLTVAQTEALVEQLLWAAPAPEKHRRPTFLVKDVRLFLNTLYPGAGADALRRGGRPVPPGGHGRGDSSYHPYPPADRS